MNAEELKAQYLHVPIADVTQPGSGLHMIYKDHWWMVTANEEVLRFRSCSWQCNSNREIVERIMPKDCGLTARQIPLVCIPVKASDYVYH